MNSLEDEQVRLSVQKLLRDESLLGSDDPVILIDLRPSSKAECVTRGILTLKGDDELPKYERLSESELQEHVSEILGSTIGASICNVTSKTGRYLQREVDVGSVSAVLKRLTRIEKDLRNVFVQRFAALTTPDDCPSPLRQLFFVNFFPSWRLFRIKNAPNGARHFKRRPSFLDTI